MVFDIEKAVEERKKKKDERISVDLERHTFDVVLALKRDAAHLENPYEVPVRGVKADTPEQAIIKARQLTRYTEEEVDMRGSMARERRAM